MSYEQMKSMPLTKQFDFNFVGYIRDNQDLHQPTTLKFDTFFLHKSFDQKTNYIFF